VNEWKIPLFKIYWDEEDVQMVSETIRRGTYWATGPEIEEFERQLSEYLGVKYCVTVNSGTSALHATLEAYEVGRGDEVIVPSFTFIATANASLFVGAKPVFADIEEVTFGLDPDSVRKKITSRTKAIIPVHFAGSPCMIEELKKIAEANGLILIEDAAEALGASVNGRRVGSIGDAAILSFCHNKIITTGEGGAVVTNSDRIYERLRLLRSHGRAETANYFSSVLPLDYVTLGYNFRMSSVLAALGIAQFRKIEHVINLRRSHSDYMTQKLSDIENISVPQVPHGYYHVYQLYPVIIKDGKATRDHIQKYLAEKGIMTKVYFAPVHLSQFYRKTFGYQRGGLPATEKVAESILALPMYPSLTEQEMDYVAHTIQEFFSNKNT
jgi:dTDP-4-amino-4,6-dideoxygalactose transaminase